MFSKRLTSKIFGLACTASLFAPGAALPAATRIAHHAKQVCLPKSTFVTYAPYTHASKGYREERRVSIFPSTADTSDAANAISPWHGISLVACPIKGTFNFVNEIPKGTRAKMEISTTEASNPIKQDIKNGKLREFAYGKIPFNYGALPQTWENPILSHPVLGLQGDNDPVDVVEISTGALPEGAVMEVKVLGALALIDEGEVDWKVIAVDAHSPLATKIDDADDLENVMPGVISSIREWFRKYKTADGKPENTFGFHEAVISVKETKEVIAETHQEWRKLVNGEVKCDKAAALWVGGGVPTAQVAAPGAAATESTELCEENNQ